MFPIEMNPESPRLRSAAFSRSARPRAPLWDEKPIESRRERPRPEGRVQARRCDGDTEAVGADQAPAASSDEGEKTVLAIAALAADLREAGRDDAERTDARSERRLGRLEHVGPGKTDDRQVDDLRHLFEGLVGAHAGNRLAGAVQGIRDTDELGVEHVSEEATADRFRPGRGADDGDAGGREEGAKRRDDREMVPLVDVREVLLGRGDRKRDLDRALVEHAGHAEADGLEDVQHRLVLRHHLGDEALDANLCRARRELLQKPCADASPLMGVGDRERGFGCPWIAQPCVVGQGNDRLALVRIECADQGAFLDPVRVEEWLDERRARLRGAVEAEVEALVGETGEKLDEGVRVGSQRRSQPERSSVAENDVDDGRRGRPGACAPGQGRPR